MINVNSLMILSYYHRFNLKPRYNNRALLNDSGDSFASTNKLCMGPDLKGPMW